MVHFHPLSKWIWDDKVLVTNVFNLKTFLLTMLISKDWCKEKRFDLQWDKLMKLINQIDRNKLF